MPQWKVSRTTMFHVAPAQRRNSILSQGLLPSKQDVKSPWPGNNRPDGVFLWDSIAAAQKYAMTQRVMSDPEFWGVDVTGLNLSRDPYFDKSKKWNFREDYATDPLNRYVGAYVTYDPIPPDRLWLEWANPWFPLEDQSLYNPQQRPAPVEDDEVYAKRGNIFDPIEKTLDQRVYNGIEPKPTILRFIEHLYFRALDQELGVTGDEWADLYLTGSLTTYQYGETSDCDVSVFPNYDKLWTDLGLDPDEARKRLIHLSIEHLDGTFLPGTQHPVQFFVVPNGQHPDDLYKPGLRSAYNFNDRQWFVPPEKDRVHNVELEYPELYARAAAMADKMNQMLDAGDTDAADKMWQQIHRKRQQDQRAGLGDFCLAPGTRVLRDDYQWVNIEDVKVGETLVGFDEFPRNELAQDGSKRGRQRTLQPAVVLSTSRQILPSFKVTTDLNGEVIASEGHYWLVRGKKRRVEWKLTEELTTGDQILRFGATWGETTDPVSAAYLAGLFDGEGHISERGKIGFTQNEGKGIIERGTELLNELGFRTNHQVKSERGSDVLVLGGVPEAMRFLAQIPTTRLRERPFWIGREICPKGPYAPIVVATVTSIEAVGDHEVIGLHTSTGTLIAEGLYTHNSEGNIVYKWFLHQGLFDRIRNELHEYIAKVANVVEMDGDYDLSNNPSEKEQEFISQSKTADLWNDKVTTKVIYDFDKDRIILGTQATQAEIPDSKIIGDYTDGIVTLYDADKQWINPTYFRRLWHFSYPERELKDVFFRRGEQTVKMRTVRRRSSWKLAASDVPKFVAGDHVIEKAYGWGGSVYGEPKFKDGEWWYWVQMYDQSGLVEDAQFPEKDLERPGRYDQAEMMTLQDMFGITPEAEEYYRSANVDV